MIRIPPGYWSWLNPDNEPEGMWVRHYHSYLRIRCCRKLKLENPHLSWNEILDIYYYKLYPNWNGNRPGPNVSMEDKYRGGILDGCKHIELPDEKDDEDTWVAYPTLEHNTMGPIKLIRMPEDEKEEDEGVEGEGEREGD